MNWAKGLRRITLLIAIVAAIVGGICTAMIPVHKYRYAQSQFGVFDPIVVQKTSQQEVEEFKKWVQEMAAKGTSIDPNYYVIDDGEAHSLKLPSLKEARPLFLENIRVRFWKNLSKPKLWGVCILASLAGASAAFLSVWLVFWFGGSAIYSVIRWVILGFCDKELKS